MSAATRDDYWLSWTFPIWLAFTLALWLVWFPLAMIIHLAIRRDRATFARA